MSEIHKRSKLDVNQMAQSVFDEESMANRVKLVDTNIAIAVNAEEGDSVVSMKKNRMLTVKNNDILDVSLVSKICVYSHGVGIVVLDENDDVLAVIPLQEQTPINIMATRVKVLIPEQLEYVKIVVQ